MPPQILPFLAFFPQLYSKKRQFEMLQICPVSPLTFLTKIAQKKAWDCSPEHFPKNETLGLQSQAFLGNFDRNFQSLSPIPFFVGFPFLLICLSTSLSLSLSVSLPLSLSRLSNRLVPSQAKKFNISAAGIKK